VRGPAAPRSGPEEGELNNALLFPNNPVTDLLAMYERLTQKTIIKDTAIFEGSTISLTTPKKVSKEDAIHLIEESLSTNGYALIPLDANTVKILSTRTQGLSPAAFSKGLSVIRDAGALPKGDELAAYFMPLRYMDPAEAAELFTDHVGLNVYGRISPISNPPGLLITESSTIIRQLIDIQEVVDAPSEDDVVKTGFIKLEHAEASIVAQIIQATLDSQREIAEGSGPTTFTGNRGNQQQGNNNQQQGGRQDPRQQQNNNNNSGSNAALDVIPPAQLVADDRLNRILVVAIPEEYEYIVELISEFDQPLDDDTPFEYPLQYVYAEEILPVIVDVLQDTGTGTAVLPGGGTLNTRTDPQSSQRTSALTGLTGQQGRQVQAADTDSTGENPDVLTAPEETTAPVSVIVGKTRIIADPRANVIFAFGPQENLDRVRQVIELLDRRPPQVYLATVIGQLTLSDEVDFGVDYLTKFQQFDGSDASDGGIAGSIFNSRTDATGSVADVRDSLITSAFGPTSGLNLYGQVGQELDVFITALESTNRFKVLSRPSIYAANNKKAVITSGQRIPVPESTLSQGTNNGNGQFQTNINFEDVVLKLEVVPLINSSGEVTLTIAQTNDTVVGSQTIDDNQIPIIGTEQLTTTVTVRDQSTIVLGGLITEENTETTSGIPFISRIPVLGVPFKRTITGTARRELIIFIQPIVVTDEMTARRASLSEDLRSTIGADAYEAFPEAHPLPEVALPYPDNSIFPRAIPAQGTSGPTPVPTHPSRSAPRAVPAAPESRQKAKNWQLRPRQPFE